VHLLTSLTSIVISARLIVPSERSVPSGARAGSDERTCLSNIRRSTKGCILSFCVAYFKHFGLMLQAIHVKYEFLKACLSYYSSFTIITGRWPHWLSKQYWGKEANFQNNLQYPWHVCRCSDQWRS